MKKLILATMIFSSFASAQDFGGFYIGAGVGSTNFEDDGYTSDMQKVVSELYNDSSITASNNIDGQTYKLIAGYMFNRVVGIEAQYTKYAPIKITDSKSLFNHEQRYSSYTFSANVGYTFDNGLRPFGTAGLGSIDLDESGSEAGGAIRLGVGLEYYIPQVEGLSFRAAYEVDSFVLDFNGKEYNQSIGSFYASASYKF
ncbi:MULTISPECIES: porin family protein [Vibrio]|uniref:Outer membrane protein beta-barrel domain-containing protein n=1 Tax=Vibrio bivalvicida TaxID=1276888 RepID=A0A177Y465_9VIBR|nr:MULTISPECIES: porin family protein [Vibrio]KLN63548.1 hypothetical protein ZX61_18650 [Vibrio sp. VPAP30]OAJ95672.1 hypothetical protein APB76_02955 [Vibrio bivalvicida]OAJ95673.1 hypothetical protein APB76_02960 [Vibrio bivalvicida]